ncbi:MAG TPA: hypothetical protein VF276_09410 [Chloroflexia bacterium]
MNDTGWWVTLLGGIGTILGIILKWRTDVRKLTLSGEQRLRDDLFKALDTQKALHAEEIAAVRAEAKREQRALSGEIKTLRSHVLKSQSDITTLNSQLYQMSTWASEVHRIALLLYPVEWAQILAQVRVPRPDWQPRPPDLLPPAEEGPADE